MKDAAILLAAAVLLEGPAIAATLDVTVKDAAGAPVQDAVAYALPKSPSVRPRPPAAIEQRDKTFIPLVSVVQAGTLVSFPNRDEIRHHVYSFSPAKVFEIKLYAGTAAPTVLFDTPGEVVLGCNIHDHMLAYVYVVDTPYFAKSGRDGVARIEAPAGDYDVHVWHYAQAAAPDAMAARVRADPVAPPPFVVTLRPQPPRPRPRPR
ncbi:MAG TPA: methylamine utilization protein [Usitatibacter sp.]|nr:methylamine utilization protein [Usitatibacter sp.]